MGCVPLDPCQLLRGRAEPIYTAQGNWQYVISG